MPAITSKQKYGDLRGTDRIEVYTKGGRRLGVVDTVLREHTSIKYRYFVDGVAFERLVDAADALRKGA